MAYLLLSILSIIVLSPLVLPWGKKLLSYCIITWFLLWLMLFIQMEREADPTYDAGIISVGTALGLSIFVFIVVVAIRCVARLIWLKISAKNNHT